MFEWTRVADFAERLCEASGRSVRKVYFLQHVSPMG